MNDGSGLTVFAQPGYPGGFDGDHLYPFHLDSFSGGECTNDINHSWAPQHGYWNGGRMDGFIRGHLAVDGKANGPLAMGYYTRRDLPDRRRRGRPPAGLMGAGAADRERAPARSPRAGGVRDRPGAEHARLGPGDLGQTALFVTYDENGGFFDHVPPPVAPPGTPGAYLTASPLPSDAGGVVGPVGLGFRAPMLIVSPFSRGGFVSGDTFDHTSVLRFLETRFGAEVPNLTAWRRSVTGDLTSAFNFAAPNVSVPALPAPSAADQRETTGAAQRAPPSTWRPARTPPSSSSRSSSCRHTR